MKRIFSGIIISTILILTIPFQTLANEELGSTSFNDISVHWAKASILQAVQTGYVQGFPDGTFRPDKKVTRAEFIKLIVSSMRLTFTNDNNDKWEKWYDPYVSTASSAGITVDGDFKEGDLNTPMTRFELARSSVRATKQTTDKDNEWMYLATKSGLIKGMAPDSSLGETLTTTRAEAVTIIERILTLNLGNKLEVDANAVKNAEELKNATYDQWGRAIRTTNLPKNYKDYSYILADVPNGMYEMQHYMFGIPAELTPKESFSKRKNFTKENIDIWASRAKAYYDMLFNVDYKTIGDSKVWANKLFSYMNHGVNVEYTMKDITKYADWVKENKIQIEGTYEPEPSMTYFNGSDFIIRAKAKITIKNFDVNKQVIYDESYNNVKLRKNKTYDTFLDTTMGTNIIGDGDYSNTIAVSNPTIYAYSSLRYMAEKEANK